ncbi:dihydrofolate reductase [Aeromicrobium phragmitis]|uniref:Dihydrofolate reductase n=1 Tax=Aeromicrobium phragmitis TaxID=2478914 RepID=A0A3L8PLJ9_9ACTN|nr:dihydrofolate reductase family protein [Aeromicrobium phragmitis]RLV55689.1 dihydrofolate reductase [Aeromicrobium phragmitis]
MTTFLYSATMSVDGYIAGAAGDMSWLKPHLAPDPLVDELVPQVSVILSGRRTYDGDDPNAGDPKREGAFEGRWHGTQVVLTHRPLADPPADVVVAGDLSDAVAAARAAAGSNGLVNILGADVARQCLDHGILDEVLVFIAPVLLGGGTRLLEGTQRTYSLRRIREAVSSDAAALWFRVTS